MPADFRTSYWLRSQSVVIEDDCLVVLESDGNRDRVRRMYFDQVQSLLVWRSLPWVLMVVSILLVVSGLLLGAGYLNAGEPVVMVVASVLLVLGIGCVALALSWKRTRLRLVRDGTKHDFHFFVQPGKARRIVERIRTNIERCQATELAKRSPSSGDGRSVLTASPDSMTGEQPEAIPQT